MEITGIEGVVGYVAFENYTMQLSRAKLMRSHVFAVKIVNAEEIHRGLSHIAFKRLLTDIATILSNIMDQDETLITYRGNGVFLCTSSARLDLTQNSFELELNRQFAETASARFGDTKVTLSVGDAISLKSLTRAGAMFSLQTAASSAETRASGSKEVLRAMKRLMMTRKRSKLQTAMERRAYEVLLSDAMRDEKSGNGMMHLPLTGARQR